MSACKSVPVGELVESVKTWNPSRSSHDEVFDYIDLSAVDQAAKEIVGAREVTCGEAPSRARQLVSVGDVLVSTVRPNLNGIAKVGAEFDGATASTGFCVLRPQKNVLSSSYLFHWVKSPQFVADMVSKATGASYPAVSDRIIFQSLLGVPPLPEQRRIAAILDQADALRAKRREALAQLDSLTQSIFIAIFGDPAKNPHHWPLMQLGAVASKFSDGPFGSNLKSEHYVEAGVRVIRLQNIGVNEFLDRDKAYVSERHFETIKKHECRPGDVLVGTMGDPNLRACVLPEAIGLAINKADCVQIRVNPKVANSDFLCDLLNHPSTLLLAQDLLHGQTRVRISMGGLRGLEVPVPPISFQQSFSKRIQSVETLKATHNAALQELDRLFASLQHRAFSGEL